MYYNEAHISMNGTVVTQPEFGETRTGVRSLRMRVAWTERRLDQATGEWSDRSTSYCTVHAYRKLAENAATCLRLGDPVVVRGRVWLREYEDRNGFKRNDMEVDAISFGHDLSRGVAAFNRTRPQTGMTATEFVESEASRPGAEPGADDLPGVGGSGGSLIDESAVAALADDTEGARVPF